MLTHEAALAVGLARAEAWLRRKLEPALGAFHGIGFTDFLILSELAAVRGGRLRSSDLADRLLFTPSGITRAVAPLEKIGLVERLRHERDARSSYVALTRAGATRVEEATPTVERIVAETLGSTVTRADRIALLGFFERIGYAVTAGSLNESKSS